MEEDISIIYINFFESQADILGEAISTVRAIAPGGRTYQDIASSIGKVERQGRYYRRAAEILGFIITPNRNTSVITDLGRRLLLDENTIDRSLLFQSVVNASVFQRLIPYMENNSEGVSREQIINFLISVAELNAASMGPRRFSSVISWSEDIGLIYKQGTLYFLSRTGINTNLGAVSFNDLREPILPTNTELTEYQTVGMRNSNAEEEIIIHQNRVAQERAENAHRTLVNLLSEKIRGAGFIPRYNQLIDLATRTNDSSFIFEMKSTTTENAKKQIRNGISQLYEYEYLQNLSNTNLVLVIENPLYDNILWMSEYLEESRNISLIWDGDGNIYGSEKTKEKLIFLDFS